MPPFDITKLRPILDCHGLSVTGHTDPCLPHAYPIHGIREACLTELERCAKMFSALGAGIMNIHPCYFCPPGMRVDWKNAVNSLKATGYDGTITLEVFCNNPDMQCNYLDLNQKLVMDLWN